MQTSNVSEEELTQLRDVLQSPLTLIDPSNHAVTFLKVRKILDASAHCCVVITTGSSSNKFQAIKNLYSSVNALNSLQRQLCKEYAPLRASMIGIYPSLEYPACVYELNTVAEHYVARNILPYSSSPMVKNLKDLVSKLLGANPAVGGLGLTLYKE